MERYRIVIVRAAVFTSSSSLATDALNAVSTIPGTSDVQIDRESDHEVELSYEWASTDKFWETGVHLDKYGVRRADWP